MQDFESDSDDSPSEASECQLSTFNCQLSPADPDVDPEWSLAPWGRRRNGKPRTEKEYRTILYRAVRDVYGLDLTESSEKHRPDQIADTPSTPDVLSPSPTPAPAIHHPTSDIADPTSDIPPHASDIPHPTSDIERPRPPPARSEISPFCRPDAPFVPKIMNPWYDF